MKIFGGKLESSLSLEKISKKFFIELDNEAEENQMKWNGINQCFFFFDPFNSCCSLKFLKKRKSIVSN